MTERLHFHFSLSCIGEGNGNPFQCSCLENPRDRGACWAMGLQQSRTWLKWLSSSSSKCPDFKWKSVVILRKISNWMKKTVETSLEVTKILILKLFDKDKSIYHKNASTSYYKCAWNKWKKKVAAKKSLQRSVRYEESNGNFGTEKNLITEINNNRLSSRMEGIEERIGELKNRIEMTKSG